MASSLLPINQSEFHTKSYWEDFFRKRGTNSFDWYGKFDDFSFLLFEQVKTHETFLVIGCGNSEFSSKLYDSQHKNISNLDFSPIVIAEMVSKNKNRPDMKWLIGDMTNMRDIFQNNLFQNVFDKGALDALVSDNSALCHEKGKQMFEEIERLLAINGKYICITLAQDFVIQSLLDYFASNISSSSILWKISISIIPSKTPSPFSPFFIVISKLPRHIDSISNSPVIAVSFDTMGKSIKQPIEVSPEECIKLIRSVQEYSERSFKLGELMPDRFESIDFWAQENDVSPRFTLTVYDSDVTSATLTCAVLILPAGREAEYQFASRNGLRDLAVQADTRRLITARLNKPHTFGDMASIQSELSPLVLTLVPRCLNTQKESIPYMALGDDNDWTQIEYNFSPVSGDYFIEERECGNDDEEGAPAGSLMRRLLFVQNQNFVQTECRLLQPTGTASVLSKGQKKRLKKKTKANTTGTSTEHKVETSVNTIVQATTSDKLVVKFIFDHTYLDSHHSAALTALSLVPNLLTTPSSASPSTISGGGDGRRGLLVGLGGGSMAMSLQKHLSDVSLVICELDGRMVDVATEFFGFVRSHHTSIVVGDGMQYINECAEKELCRQIKHLHINTTTATSTTSTDIVDDVQANSFTYIFIDVDGKDTTLGLTAPPETFISQQSLQSMYDALAPDGVLILNVVARGGQEPIDALVARLKSVFVKHNNQESGAFMIKPSETTVNIIIAAVKCGVVSINKDGEEKPLKTSATSKKKTSKKRVDGDSSNRLQSIRIWLDSVHGSTKTDPLNLTDLVTKLVPL